MTTATQRPLTVDVCRQSWHAMHQPWVALVWRTPREILGRGFGDTEEDAIRAALAKVSP